MTLTNRVPQHGGQMWREPVGVLLGYRPRSQYATRAGNSTDPSRGRQASSSANIRSPGGRPTRSKLS
jgi:hypothetical protein